MEIQINQKKQTIQGALAASWESVYIYIYISIYIYIQIVWAEYGVASYVHKILESLEIIFWKLLSPLHDSIRYRGIIGFAMQVPGAILVLVRKLVLFSIIFRYLPKPSTVYTFHPDFTSNKP